jgi:uncharacterized protein (TIRG00374 family)
MKWSVLGGIVTSIIFGFVLSYQIDVRQLVTALQSTHNLLLLLALGAFLGTLLLRAWRWQYLLEAVKPIRTLPLFSATAIGFMANMLLPAHAGEVVRAYLLGQKEQISATTCFATIVVERLLDLVSLLLILAVTLVWGQLPLEAGPVAESVRIGGYGAAFLCVAVAVGLWLLRAQTAMMISVIRVCLRFLPDRWLARLTTFLHAFASGLEGLHKGRRLLLLLFQSLALWLLMAGSDLLVLIAFGLHLPISAALFVLVVQALGVMIPSSPGFIGTYHAAVVIGLAVFGVGRELALSVALVMHAVFFFPSIILGGIFLWKDNLSLRSLWALKAAGYATHKGEDAQKPKRCFTAMPMPDPVCDDATPWPARTPRQYVEADLPGTVCHRSSSR